ncbi:hypothetical protein ACLOJK_007562 [Asimina triloba]
MNVHPVQCTTGAPESGAPSSPWRCRPTHRWRAANRQIQADQNEGNIVLSSSPPPSIVIGHHQTVHAVDRKGSNIHQRRRLRLQQRSREQGSNPWPSSTNLTDKSIDLTPASERPNLTQGKTQIAAEGKRYPSDHSKHFQPASNPSQIDAAPIPSDAASRGPPPQQPIKQSMATRSIQQPFPSHAQQQRVRINHDRARQGARIREQLGRKKFVNNSNSSNGPDNGQHRFKTGRSSQQHQPQSLPQKFRSTASKKSEFESIKDTTNPTEISTQFGSEQRGDEKSWPIKAFHIRHASTKGITAVEVILTKHDSSVPLRQASYVTLMVIFTHELPTVECIINR